MSLAWHIGAFSGAAFAGKLKKFSEYRGDKRPQQTPSEMIAVLKAIRENGAPMNIRRVN